MPTGCIINFPQKGVAGHVAPKFLAYTIKHIFKTARARDFKFGT